MVFPGFLGEVVCNFAVLVEPIVGSPRQLQRSARIPASCRRWAGAQPLNNQQPQSKIIPGSSKYVKFVPFHPKNLPKGRNFTYLEDPGIVIFLDSTKMILI